MPRKPDFFIVGAPKCGTTALNDYLAAHSDIYMARKEMHLFGSDLRFGSQFYRRDADAYLAELDTWSGQRLIGEASVWYLFSKLAASEMKAFNPEARVIIMLREPAEMLCSLYCQFLLDGNEDLPSFEEALAAESERRAGKRTSRQTYLAQALDYRATARYTEQVKRYFDTFGRDRVHVILYDDFAGNISNTYRGVLDFLGVDSTSIKNEFKKVNANQCVKNSALHAFLGDPRLRATILAIRPWIPRAAFNALQQVDARIRKFNSRPGGRPNLTSALRQQLKSEFASEVEYLSELLGRDLTHWNHNAPIRMCNDSPIIAPMPAGAALTTDCAEGIETPA